MQALRTDHMDIIAFTSMDTDRNRQNSQINAVKYEGHDSITFKNLYAHKLAWIFLFRPLRNTIVGASLVA